METRIVKSQADWDALPESFTAYTRIEIRTTGQITITGIPENSSVEAWGNSSVVARGNSSVVAWGNSSVVARGNSSVVARGNSSVEARENSSVVARGNSSVVAWENSSVEARGNSSVVAWENSSVVAWENSSVEAWGNSFCRNFSGSTKVGAHGYAIVLLQTAEADAISESSGAHILRVPMPQWTAGEWLEREGIVMAEGFAVLYKRVSAGFLTQEGEKWETRWSIGSHVEHPNWHPSGEECGAGKFHACSRPYFCDEFRSQKGDRYITLRIRVNDLFAWPNPAYPHKIAFRACEVIHECDRRGQAIKTPVEVTA